MMILPLLMASAALGQPTGLRPTNPATWMRENDNVTGQDGSVGIRLSIDEKGKPYRCEVTATSGSADLDKVTCLRALSRSRFRPALDFQGSPVASDFSTTFNWGHHKSPNDDHANSNAFVHLSEIYPEIKNDVGIWQVVSPDDKVISCGPIDASVPETLVNSLCAALVGQATPLTNAGGTKVTSLITWIVYLTTDDKAPARPAPGATFALEAK